MWLAGNYQFIPFLVTLSGWYLRSFDGGYDRYGRGYLLILYNNFKLPYRLDMTTMEPGVPTRFELSEDVSFLNKAAILQTLNKLPYGAHVIIDASRTIGLDPDVIEIIQDQAIRAKEHNTIIELVGIDQQR